LGWIPELRVEQDVRAKALTDEGRVQGHPDGRRPTTGAHRIAHREESLKDAFDPGQRGPGALFQVERHQDRRSHHSDEQHHDGCGTPDVPGVRDGYRGQGQDRRPTEGQQHAHGHHGQHR
jgi:hypothetical protein